MNGERFRAYVEHQLALILRRGDIAVMGNLGSYKCSGRPARDPSGRCVPMVSAALLARPQSDKTGLRKDRTLDAQGAKANDPERVATHRVARQEYRARRMRKILRQRRRRFHQSVKRSS
jgi:hypothetical protein